MPGLFGDIQQQLNDFWQGLDKGQKVKLLSVVVLSVLIVVIGIYVLSRPKFEVLYSRLDEKDMADATKKLSELKIDYKISEDGYSLLVPRALKNEAKLALADANIPKKGATYADAFSSKSMFGATESDKTRQYIEFKAEELARVLVENSDAILNAEVFLNIPEDTSFFGETKKATASVKITPNGELSPSQIEGIARFVANSVAGLDPKNVEVVDNNMNILKDFDDPSIGGAGKQFTLAEAVNKKYEDAIRKLLFNQSTEYDDVKVVANLKLDFNTEDVDAKIIEPVMDGTGAIISQNEKKEQLINGSTTGGVPGTDSNSGVPSYPSEGSNGSSYTNSDTTTNYVYNEKVVKTSKALGQVDRDNSTIAVSLYYGRNVEQAPSLDVINKVKNQVSMATGLSKDKISVESFKITKETAKKSSFNFLYALQQYGVIVVSAILLIILAIGVFTAPKKLGVTIPSDLTLNKPKKPEIQIEEIEIEEKSEIKKQIDKFIKQKPEAVANLLRNWLTEEWE